MGHIASLPTPAPPCHGVDLGGCGWMITYWELLETSSKLVVNETIGLALEWVPSWMYATRGDGEGKRKRTGKNCICIGRAWKTVPDHLRRFRSFNWDDSAFCNFKLWGELINIPTTFFAHVWSSICCLLCNSPPLNASQTYPNIAVEERMQLGNLVLWNNSWGYPALVQDRARFSRSQGKSVIVFRFIFTFLFYST